MRDLGIEADKLMAQGDCLVVLTAKSEVLRHVVDSSGCCRGKDLIDLAERNDTRH